MYRSTNNDSSREGLDTKALFGMVLLAVSYTIYPLLKHDNTVADMRFLNTSLVMEFLNFDDWMSLPVFDRCKSVISSFHVRV